MTSSAHVTEGSLAGPVGTTTTDSRNTCNGTTSSPRLGTGLVTSLRAHTMRHEIVFAHLGVHMVDKIYANWSIEDFRKRDSLDRLPTPFAGVDGHHIPSHLGCHFKLTA